MAPGSAWNCGWTPSRSSTARALIEDRVHPGATMKNLAYYGPFVHWGDGVGVVERKIVADPQTSGGLLIAIAPDRKDALIQALSDEGAMCAAVVGRLVEGEGITVERARPAGLC